MSWIRIGDVIGRRLFREEKRKFGPVSKSKPVRKKTSPPKVLNSELNDSVDDLFRD